MYVVLNKENKNDFKKVGNKDEVWSKFTNNKQFYLPFLPLYPDNSFYENGNVQDYIEKKKLYI